MANFFFLLSPSEDGTCGAFVANATCDVDVSATVRELCLGRTSCALPASGDAWPAARCLGVSRLFVQVKMGRMTMSVNGLKNSLPLPHQMQ